MPEHVNRRAVLHALTAVSLTFGVSVSCRGPEPMPQKEPESPTSSDEEPATMTNQDPVERLSDAINSHDPQQVADCFTADFRSEVPHRPAEGFVGSDRVADNWAAIFERLPDLKARVIRRAAAGAELWSEWEMTGTAPDGTPALLCGPAIMTTRDGRIAWTRFYLAPVAGPAG